MPWTQFWDMHSGGGQKLDWAKIYIEAPEQEAVSVFYSRFRRNPNRVTCTCCGPDYSITESETLEEATEYHRTFDYGPRKGTVLTIEEYLSQGGKEGLVSPRETALAIYAKDITPEERQAHVPDEGYLWHG